MKLIDSSVEFLGEVPTSIPAALRFIERVTRTCYKSEDKITPTSALPFIKTKLLKPNPKHTAMLEHSNFVVQMEFVGTRQEYIDFKDSFTSSLCSPTGRHLRVATKLISTGGKNVEEHDMVMLIQIGGNYTAWYNHVNSGPIDHYQTPFIDALRKNLFDEPPPLRWGERRLSYGTNLEQWRECAQEEILPELRRYSAKFVCDTGVSHELVRHRNHSYAQESTRYCDYSNLGIQFIRPADYDNWDLAARWALYLGLLGCTISYKVLRFLGLAPQKARAVLPKALKTEVYATGYLSDWKHLLKLRTGAGAHPDFRKLAIDLQTQMAVKHVL